MPFDTKGWDPIGTYYKDEEERRRRELTSIREAQETKRQTGGKTTAAQRAAHERAYPGTSYEALAGGVSPAYQAEWEKMTTDMAAQQDAFLTIENTLFQDAQRARGNPALQQRVKDSRDYLNTAKQTLINGLSSKYPQLAGTPEFQAYINQLRVTLPQPTLNPQPTAVRPAPNSGVGQALRGAQQPRSPVQPGSPLMGTQRFMGPLQGGGASPLAQGLTLGQTPGAATPQTEAFQGNIGKQVLHGVDELQQFIDAPQVQGTGVNQQIMQLIEAFRKWSQTKTPGQIPPVGTSQ